MDIGEDRLSLLSSRIIGCALTVLHGLGAMGSWSREYTVDPLVEHIVLVELKVAKGIDEIHRAQCLNYLKATGLHLCLLLNFGRPRLEIKRIVLDL